MKKFYALNCLLFTLFFQSVFAQCPTPTGMVAVPVSLNGNCFINVQFAIPNSNVSIYNAAGFVAQGTATSSGNIVIPYPCGGNPITGITSLVATPAIQICNIFTITPAVVLPVKLLSFSGVISREKTVLLKWETTLEVSNEKYEVERSIDGINYTRLASVKGNESGLGKHSYSFEDVLFTPGTSAFYRLKQIDFDGKWVYSNVVYISDKSSDSGNYSLFPNPVNTSTNNTVQIKGIAANEVTYNNISITDISGRKVSYKITGANAIELYATAPGIYIVRIKDKALTLFEN